MKGKQSLAVAGWALAGIFVSLSIIETGRFSLFGYPLLVLSLLLAMLVLWRRFRA